ncbi:MAG: ATP-grasp domain-containing protein, partial [Planctomycetia bacterium]
DAGLPFPETTDDPPARAAGWLRKPRRGAGGRGVDWLENRAGDPSEEQLYQRCVDGAPHSAAYAVCAGEVAMIGVTRMLVGESFCRAAPFHYCGSVGPIVLPLDARRRLLRFGETLAKISPLRGLIGVDFILDGFGTPWPLECNPRWTASMELFDRAGGRLFDFFVDDRTRPMEFAAQIQGKAVVFAPFDGVVRPDAPCYTIDVDDPFPPFADVPPPASVVPAGWPVLTVFAAGATAEEVLNGLRITAERFLVDDFQTDRR